jgi:hypothetical protein
MSWLQALGVVMLHIARLPHGGGAALLGDQEQHRQGFTPRRSESFGAQKKLQPKAWNLDSASRSRSHDPKDLVLTQI